MYEISLSIALDKSYILDKIEKRLNYSLKGLNRVTARTDKTGRSYLLIGCDDDVREYAEDCIIYTLADVIITDFKADFIKKNARFSINNELNYHAFINALVAFDRESDRELILKKLTLEKTTMIDGLFNFRLREICSRWQEVVDLASDNSVYLMYDDTFFELLRFLISTIDSKIEEVEIEADDNFFNIHSEFENELTYELIDVEENKTEKLIPILINLAPKKITFTSRTNLPEKIRYVISEIYPEKAVFN